MHFPTKDRVVCVLHCGKFVVGQLKVGIEEELHDTLVATIANHWGAVIREAPLHPVSHH